MTYVIWHRKQGEPEYFESIEGEYTNLLRAEHVAQALEEHGYITRIACYRDYDKPNFAETIGI